MEINWKNDIKKYVDKQKKEISEVVIEFANHDDQ
jgi:hypothetical protein